MTEGRIRESNRRSSNRHTRYEPAGGESPSIAVATALAAYFGEDVMASTVRLYDYVDPEALDALFAETRRGTTRSVRSVEFAIDDVTVVVRPDHVEIVPAE